MGQHADYLRGTADTLRRIATEADHNFTAAEQAIGEVEAAHARQDASERADLAAKFPQLEGR